MSRGRLFGANGNRGPMTQDGDHADGRSDIDTHLRRAFTQLADTALPDDLVALLDRLRAEDEARLSGEEQPE